MVVVTNGLETPLASVLIIASGKCEYTFKNDVLMSFLTQSLDKVYLESVREKEGGSYGVSVYGQLSRYPNDDEAFLQIYFDTDPAKREKMTQIIMNELQKIAQDGPAAEHINKTKEFMLKKHTEQMKENGYWLNILNQYYWYKADMDSNFQQVVESITPEDVKQFAKALLEQNNCIEVSMTSGETK